MDDSAGYTAVDTSVCLHVEQIEDRDIAILSGPAVPCRVLRGYDDGSMRSGVARLEAGWASGDGTTVPATTQLYLLSGALDIGDSAVSTGGFAVLPAGATAPRVTASQDSRVIVIVDAPPGGGASSAHEPRNSIVIEDTLGLPAITPVIAGRQLDGFERRVLWEDAATGADTRLLRVPAGFRGGGPNWHPVHEEIFCIEGDIEPDETRPMRAGSFLWNPARSVHGFDEHTCGGCLLLEWHDGPWALISAPGTTRPAA